MKTARSQRTLAMLSGVLVAFAAATVNAAVTIPDKPLLVADGVAPNILFILDDSGSMQFTAMPEDAYDRNIAGQYGIGLADRPEARSSEHNSIYYDPSKTYLPWKNADGSRMANTPFTAVWTNPVTLASDDSFVNWNGNNRGTGLSEDLSTYEQIFYVLKSGSPAKSTSASDYDRFSIRTTGGVTRIYKGSVSRTSEVLGSNFGATAKQSYIVTANVPAGTTSVTFKLSGPNGDADLYAKPSANNAWFAQSLESGSNESINVTNPVAGQWTVSAYAYQTYTGASLSAEYVTSSGETEATPTGRSVADELQNYANWFSYHRTRVKVAKAGASEAFSELGPNVRVGFDTIWNRPQGSTSNGSPSGSTPSMLIPGRFEGGNRTSFFTYLQSAQATNGTPLHGALQRAGRYFETSAPYKDTSGGTPLACRANYAILTTDGFWNSDSGYSASGKPGGGSIGDEDGDGHAQTLADVAYAYYAKDLMSSVSGEQALEDKLEASNRDPNKFQHMVTFGVSIGLKGTKDVPADESQWPAGGDKNYWPDVWGSQDSPSGTWGNSASARRIDDLWHAAVNSTGKFIVASDSKSFSEGLRSALAEIQDRRLSGGGITTNSSRLDEDTRTFQATFNPANWQGDVIAYNSSDSGGDTEAWRYTTKVQAAGTGFSSGTVLTHDGTRGRVFATGGTPDVATSLARTVGGVDYTADQIVSYLKGNPQFEARNGGKLRDRTIAVGDIVNSSPYFDRETDTLYVGANDGFLHAMAGADGTPKFRYLPRAAFTRLSELADPSYGKDASHPHRHFMDGQVFVSPKLTSPNMDRNFLLGAMGRGGKGVFMLDVTSPGAMDEGKVLWDRTFQGAGTGADMDMGYVLGQTAILKDQRERTLAIVPNGVNSTNGSAVLFVYELAADGSANLILRLDSKTTDNGMMSLGAADANSDGLVDSLYAGDLKGNVWKWVIDPPRNRNDTPEWRTALGTASAPTPMFVAKNSANQVQAITSGIAVSRKPGNSQLYVVFGTGRYIEDADVNNTETQTIYSLIDDPANTSVINGRANLTRRQFTGVGLYEGKFARALKDYAEITSGTRGWYLDLGVGDANHSAAGERVIARPQVRGDMLVVGTLIPKASTDPCDAGRTSGFDIRLNVYTGTNPATGSYYGRAGGTTKRLGGATSGTDNAIGSVQSGVGGIGGVRITNKDVILGGMDGEISRSEWNNPNNTQPRRINWREIVEGM